MEGPAGAWQGPGRSTWAQGGHERDDSLSAPRLTVRRMDNMLQPRMPISPPLAAPVGSRKRRNEMSVAEIVSPSGINAVRVPPGSGIDTHRTSSSAALALLYVGRPDESSCGSEPGGNDGPLPQRPCSMPDRVNVPFLAHLDDDSDAEGNAIEEESDDDFRHRASSLVARTTSKNDLLALFHLTLTEAAITLGVGRTYFKKICRMKGISSWPNHQKLRRETVEVVSDLKHQTCTGVARSVTAERPKDVAKHALTTGSMGAANTSTSATFSTSTAGTCETSFPLPHNESQRLRVLHSGELLDTVADSRIDHLTKAAKILFDVPIALVSLVDAERQWFKSCIGLDVKETPRSVAFCSYTVMPACDDCFIVEDALNDERFRNNPLVTGPPYIRYYVGASLQVDGVKIGSLCVIDVRPRTFNKDEFMRMTSTLAQLAKAVVSQLYANKPASSVPVRLVNAATDGQPDSCGGRSDSAQFSSVAMTKDDASTSMKRQRRKSAAETVNLYAGLYARIKAKPEFEAVKKSFSDKELRILMRENKIMINTLNPATGKYVEKTKNEKLRALIPMVDQLIAPDTLRLKAGTAHTFTMELYGKVHRTVVG
eukprot:SAG31_NODE_1163_length_9588_cov_8.265676_1_plen_598_part_00